MKQRDKLKLTLNDPKQSSKEKQVRIKITVGDDPCAKTGGWNYKHQRFEFHDGDRYVEEVIDPKTGQMIHYCDEPLSKHTGHGSAKFKKSKKNKL